MNSAITAHGANLVPIDRVYEMKDSVGSVVNKLTKLRDKLRQDYLELTLSTNTNQGQAMNFVSSADHAVSEILSEILKELKKVY
jgi:hydroxymethylglutaryl-CoA reductase